MSCSHHGGYSSWWARSIARLKGTGIKGARHDMRDMDILGSDLFVRALNILARPETKNGKLESWNERWSNDVVKCNPWPSLTYRFLLSESFWCMQNLENFPFCTLFTQYSGAVRTQGSLPSSTSWRDACSIKAAGDVGTWGASSAVLCMLPGEPTTGETTVCINDKPCRALAAFCSICGLDFTLNNLYIPLCFR